jgi:hypothetical protein
VVFGGDHLVISTNRAPMRRITDALSGKIPTTSVRRSSSRLSRSMGLFDQISASIRRGHAGWQPQRVGVASTRMPLPTVVRAIRVRCSTWRRRELGSGGCAESAPLG